MKFNYSYQKVLDLKSNEKTQAEWLLSAAVGELEQLRQSLTELIEDKQRLIHHIQSEAENCASLSKLQELQRYAEHLERCIEKKCNEVDFAEQNVEKSQEQLTTKMLDEKVWLKAKEKAKSIFQHQMLLREQSELDEMATVRFAMRAR